MYTKRIKTEMLFKLSNLNSNLALTLGYINLALNNSAQFLNEMLKPEITKLFGHTLLINRKRRKFQKIKQRELFGDTI